MAPPLARDPAALEARAFDLLVAGGGITGACIAWDAALRGLSVALVEKDDIGGATSAASSKLLHSGVRYLQQGLLGKVRESAVERAIFQHIAPHLSRYVPFLIPTSRGVTKGAALVGAGLALFRVVSAGADRVLADPDQSAPSPRFLPRHDLVDRYPVLSGLDGLTGAWVLHELHMHSSERMTLAVVKSAAREGASILNYAELSGIAPSGDLLVADIVDRATGARLAVRTRVLVNAAGPWIAALNERLHVTARARPITGFSRGAHILVRELLPVAVALPTRHRGETLVDRGGRHIFIIPWRGRSLIGTSNAPFDGTPDSVAVTEADIAGLLHDVNGALPALALSRDEVRHAFAGLYPLTSDVIRPDVYQMTGDYQIVDHGGAAGAGHVVTVLGAKYTTARRVAEQAVDLVVRKLARPAAPCRTRATRLVGAPTGSIEALEREIAARLGPESRDEVAANLARHYGTEAFDVLAVGAGDAALSRPLSPDRSTIGAEVAYAVRHELALCLDDVVFRRSGLGTLGNPGSASLEAVATLMARELGWNTERRERELAQTAARFVSASAYSRST